MARTTSVSATFGHTSASPVSSVPFSMSAWFYSTNVGLVGFIRSVNNTAGTEYCGICNNNTSPAMFWKDVGGIDALNMTGVTLAINNWYCMVGVVTSLSRRDLWIIEPDGTITTKSDTTTRTEIASYDATHIGKLWTVNQFRGDLAETGFWNVALTTGEVYALLHGYAPSLIRPESLVGYHKLIEQTDTDDAFDETGNITIPTQGASDPLIATHPPNIIYPSSPLYGIPSGAAPPQIVGPFPTFFRVP